MTEVLDGYKGEESESKPEYQFNIDDRYYDIPVEIYWQTW